MRYMLVEDQMKAEHKDFTIIDKDSNTLHHCVKEALHIHIKDPSLNSNIGKVRIPSKFNQFLKLYTKLEQLFSSIPPLKGTHHKMLSSPNLFKLQVLLSSHQFIS